MAAVQPELLRNMERGADAAGIFRRRKREHVRSTFSHDLCLNIRKGMFDKYE